MDAADLAQSLDHLVVPVDDIVVAEEFYVRVFGVVTSHRRAAEFAQSHPHRAPRGQRQF